MQPTSLRGNKAWLLYVVYFLSFGSCFAVEGLGFRGRIIPLLDYVFKVNMLHLLTYTGLLLTKKVASGYSERKILELIYHSFCTKKWV